MDSISHHNVLTLNPVISHSLRADVSKFKFEGKTFYVIGVQREVSYMSLPFSKSPSAKSYVHTHPLPVVSNDTSAHHVTAIAHSDDYTQQCAEVRDQPFA